MARYRGFHWKELNEETVCKTMGRRKGPAKGDDTQAWGWGGRWRRGRENQSFRGGTQDSSQSHTQLLAEPGQGGQDYLSLVLFPHARCRGPPISCELGGHGAREPGQCASQPSASLRTVQGREEWKGIEWVTASLVTETCLPLRTAITKPCTFTKRPSG